MMEIARLGKAEQSLQKPVHRRRSFKVLSAHYVGHALKRVIDDDCDVIAA